MDDATPFTLEKLNDIFSLRAFEHLGVSLRTGKKYTYNQNNNNNSTILQQLHQSEECNGEQRFGDNRES